MLTCDRTPEASWHTDYRDTAFIYFGGLPYELSEGDIITIFSQYGEPVFIKLARDRETGKSKGFGWLKYADQRSTDLAVDNFGGAAINGRIIRVDHARYKPREDEDIEAGKVGWEDLQKKEGESIEGESEDTESEDDRPLIAEERELQLLIRDHDDDDPMKEFLVEEKKKEVAEALRKYNREKKKNKHRHRRYHRSHRHADSEKHMNHGYSRNSRRSSRERKKIRARDRTNYSGSEKEHHRYWHNDRHKHRDRNHEHHRSPSQER